MRTTVTLDPDIAAHLKKLAEERNVSFKEILNSTIRAGLAAGRHPARPYRLQTARLGLRPGLDLDRALRLAAAMEDDEIVRKLEMRK
jgi:hypothetical protein